MIELTTLLEKIIKALGYINDTKANNLKTFSLEEGVVLDSTTVDLNSITEIGNYKIIAETINHSPIQGVTSCILKVFEGLGDNSLYQLLYWFNTNQDPELSNILFQNNHAIFIRYYSEANYWSDWQQLFAKSQNYIPLERGTNLDDLKQTGKYTTIEFQEYISGVPESILINSSRSKSFTLEIDRFFVASNYNHKIIQTLTCLSDNNTIQMYRRMFHYVYEGHGWLINDNNYVGRWSPWMKIVKQEEPSL